MTICLCSYLQGGMFMGNMYHGSGFGWSSALKYMHDRRFANKFICYFIVRREAESF